MTVLKSAYDTTACKDYVMKRTVDAIATARTHGRLPVAPGSKFTIREVQGGDSVTDDIPAFAHPVVIDDNICGIDVVIDVRGYGKYDPRQDQFHVRNETDYALAGYRARLNYVWATENPALLRDISPMPMSVFAAWISENLSRRFGLDPKEQFQIAILAAIWYNSQFSNDVPEERQKLALATAASRALRCQAQDVLEVADSVPTIASVQHFCEAAFQVTGSVRLKDLGPGLLFAILGSTWFSPNAKELVAVALEHPPTWISILLMAVTDRSMKNTPITKITERSAYRNEGTSLVRSVQQLVGAFAGA